MAPAKDEWYELRNAVWTKNFDRASALLDQFPDLIGSRSGIGETVLHYLAVENDMEGVKWLYARGFDLDTTNEFGTPVVFEVALLGYRDLLLWFLQNNVDMKATNAEDQDIFAYLHEYEKQEMSDFLRAKLP